MSTKDLAQSMFSLQQAGLQVRSCRLHIACALIAVWLSCPLAAAAQLCM